MSSGCADHKSGEEATEGGGWGGATAGESAPQARSHPWRLVWHGMSNHRAAEFGHSNFYNSLLALVWLGFFYIFHF